MAVIKIHGTSGAGKTTAVRDLMEFADQILPIGPVKRPEAYKLIINQLSRPVFVLGPYENACGGMDCVTSVDDQIARIHKYAEVGHVVYEGLLLSTYYGRLGFAVERYGKDHYWVFLDTPIDVCIERIKQRRKAAGNDKPLNEDNTRKRMKPIAALRTKLLIKGASVVDLAYDDRPGEHLLMLLEDSEIER
jgi:hypothetical protein